MKGNEDFNIDNHKKSRNSIVTTSYPITDAKRRIDFSTALTNIESNNKSMDIVNNSESKEGEILLKNIKSNLFDIRNNIDQVYDNINNPQVNQASTTTIMNLNEISKLKTKINSLQSENNRLSSINTQLINQLNISKKTEVIKYQKKYLKEMKELESYFSSIIIKFNKELDKVKKDNVALIKWKEDNCAYTDDLLQKNLELRKEVVEATELYQNTINILKLKIAKLQYKYNNMEKCGYNSHLLNSLTISNTNIKANDDNKGYTTNDIWSDGFDFQYTKINSDCILSNNSSINQENIDILRLCSDRYASSEHNVI